MAGDIEKQKIDKFIAQLELALTLTTPACMVNLARVTH